MPASKSAPVTPVNKRGGSDKRIFEAVVVNVGVKILAIRQGEGRIEKLGWLGGGGGENEATSQIELPHPDRRNVPESGSRAVIESFRFRTQGKDDLPNEACGELMYMRYIAGAIYFFLFLVTLLACLRIDRNARMGLEDVGPCSNRYERLGRLFP